MQDADALIRRFADYLSVAWPPVEKIVDHCDQAVLGPIGGRDQFVEDWLQASWERLVEACLPGMLLNVYGSADVHPDSSRVGIATAPMPTHIVVCRPRDESATSVIDVLSGEAVQFPDDVIPIDRLMAYVNGYWADAPPVDHVRVGGNDAHLLPFAAVRFWVRAIKPEEI